MPDRLNAAEYLVDRHVRSGDGERTAVLATGRTLSYAQLADEVHRVAAGLKSIGVRPEERVMFCMADDVELLAGILGTMYLGAVPVPVSTMSTGAELARLLVDSRARVLCVSTEFAGVAGPAVGLAPEVTAVVLDGETEFAARPGLSVHRWDELCAAGEGQYGTAFDAYPTWPDSSALWLYTSGTTGQPKAAIHRHASIRAVTTCYGSGVLGVGREDRCLSVAKLFFAYGLGNSAFFPLAAGGTTVLERARPTPEVMAVRATADRPTLFFGVPTFYAALLNSDIPDDSFASVRQGISAGEALPPMLFKRFWERFGVEILDGIGSTEALHIFLSNRPGRAVAGTTGTPVPGYEVEIRDEHGRGITTVDTPGDLYLRGPSTAVGYWCRTETNWEVFQGQWMRTGDTYQRNPDGTYTCLGRSNDMLKAGGIWVSPAEVEERLLEHPDVAAAVVVAAADEAGLDKPVACVVPVDGHPIDEDGLIAWCRDGLASFKRPRAVVVLAELPKTATGKIRRNVLRELVRDVLTADQPQRPDLPGQPAIPPDAQTVVTG